MHSLLIANFTQLLIQIKILLRDDITKLFQ